MIVFKLDLEIDGFFFVEKEFKLALYQAEELYFCDKKERSSVEKDTYIVYEVKSGKDFASLSKQIIRDYEFFNKFLDVYPKYDKNKLIFFGFLRTNQKIENLQLSLKYNFDNLCKIPLPVILLRYQDNLFGESVFYENVELGELGELKYMVHKNSENIEKLNKEVKEINGKIDILSDNVRKILEKIDGNNCQNNANNNNVIDASIQQVPNYLNNMNPSMMMNPLGVYFMPIIPTSQVSISPNRGSSKKDEEFSKKKQDK